MYILKVLTLLVLILNLTYSNAQEARSFTFNNDLIEYVYFTNMSSALQDFPNHNAKIILVKEDSDIRKHIEFVNIKNQSEARKDNTFYYHVKLPKLKNINHYIKFFETFVKTNYRQDFFDRNKVSLSLNDEVIPFDCASLSRLHSTFAKILVSKSSSLLDCKIRFVVTDNTEKNESFVTSEKYDISNHQNASQKRAYYKMLNELVSWRKTFFLTVSFGQNFIDGNYKTDFDEETLVDISNINSLWNFDFGYMFTDRFGALIDFAVLSTKEQEIDFSDGDISGSGYGAGVFKTGIGLRYIPFLKKNWSVYTDVSVGSINVKAGGGSGSLFGGRSFNESSEKSNFLGFSLGTNYRLGKVVYCNGNFEYTNSKFKNNIGSIRGFTGYSISVGLGLSF